MDKKQLQNRTKRFVLDVISFVGTLPRNRVMMHISDQLVRSASSVGANYRASCRAKSQADFIFKIGIVEEEADESLFWLEILQDIGVGDVTVLSRLLEEANELVAIFTASGKTAKSNKKPKMLV